MLARSTLSEGNGYAAETHPRKFSTIEVGKARSLTTFADGQSWARISARGAVEFSEAAFAKMGS